MRTIAAIALVLCGAAVGRLNAQGVSSGYVFGGGTVGGIGGAGRFGMGLDVGVAPRFTLGGELGLIEKDNNVGFVLSCDLTFHFERQHHGWDPFLDGGISDARLGGVNGVYLNLGAGFNYWFVSRLALRGEFKGYAGGQDLGGFTELRVGLTFRP